MTGSMEARRVGAIALVDGDFWYVAWNKRRFAISLAVAKGMKLVPGKRISFIARCDRVGEWWAVRLRWVDYQPPPSAEELHKQAV